LAIPSEPAVPCVREPHPVTAFFLLYNDAFTIFFFFFLTYMEG
jgi:hypothetical protein